MHGLLFTVAVIMLRGIIYRQKVKQIVSNNDQVLFTDRYPSPPIPVVLPPNLAIF